MRVVTTIFEMRQQTRQLRTRAAEGLLGLVPTMGALHPGHLSLLRAAREQCAGVAASIFVNPLQFGPGEDFSQYPRTFESDCRQMECEGVDLLFAPAAAEMYPPGATTSVEVHGVGDRLDGVRRPGHFRGVATVVAKLFHIVQPDAAFFGQKDAAQVAVLRAMVRDLNFGVRLVVCPTVRELDGLAMSSRNSYLSSDERRQALTLPRALHAADALMRAGEHSAARLVERMLEVFAGEPGVEIEYASVVNPETLEPVTDVRDGALIAVCARVGRTRLIDNFVVEPGGNRG